VTLDQLLEYLASHPRDGDVDVNQCPILIQSDEGEPITRVIGVELAENWLESMSKEGETAIWLKVTRA